ncbi:MAG TPA: macro domain-containing protein [Bacillota bacterium]|nr:macro domain-containing protein [Bacillota bacterium]HQE01515.1 macro domain-containing protein [Bacillota bacterium]
MRILVDGVTIECSIGNITAQADMDAIVNPAAPGLVPGAGVSGAIHSKAGPELYQECLAHAPLNPGQAIITSACRLPNKKVIHCLPPAGSCNRSVALLEKCYLQSLLLADEHGLTSVAFPSLFSGSLGTPPVSAAAIALRAVRKAAPLLRNVRRVCFVLFDRHTFLHYRNLMAANPESVIHTTITG